METNITFPQSPAAQWMVKARARTIIISAPRPAVATPRGKTPLLQGIENLPFYHVRVKTARQERVQVAAPATKGVEKEATLTHLVRRRLPASHSRSS